MSQPGFDYSRFLTGLKLHTFETISTAIVIILLVDFALKEIRPSLKRIRDFFSSS